MCFKNGAALAQMGQKVVIVDFDVGLRNLDPVSYTHLTLPTILLV